MTNNKPRTNFFQLLLQRYRVVIIADNSLEERMSIRFSILNFFTATLGILIFIVFVTLFIVTNTGLSQYIPGRSKDDVLKSLVTLTIQADSLQAALNKRDAYLNNIESVLSGKDSFLINKNSINSEGIVDLENISFEASQEDSILRVEVENEERGSLNYAEKESGHFVFFPPVFGYVSDTFNFQKKHFAVDLVAKKNSKISSVLAGTVVVSDWSSEVGYVIGIQHKNNYLSFYKHNSILLKKVGDFVAAGEHIAVIGNSGEFSTGPHLHFELWHNGTPVNPLDYIKF
jgi:murein DD-endopeptidase MepM/ murein hydrolase activator NlpD|tara:strand:+ start:89296 stop:90156 length:861 start_codon:yes stop_codon:yes gene_type:complete